MIKLFKINNPIFQDPNKAIPKGTILAIIYCSIAYAAVAIICGVTVARQGANFITYRLKCPNFNQC